jgi:hypothetical protein
MSDLQSGRTEFFGNNSGRISENTVSPKVHFVLYVSLVRYVGDTFGDTPRVESALSEKMTLATTNNQK